MLQTLEMRGYRGFESYQLADLARVNLLVGKNNCGKTSVLEAIELLVSGGRPTVFSRSLQRRGESGARHPTRSRDWPGDVSHVFFGHSCSPGARFDLSSDDGKRTLRVTILSLEEIGENAEEMDPASTQRLQRSLFDPDEDAATPVFAMRIDRDAPDKPIVLPVMEDGTILLERQYRWMRYESTGTPVHFLTLESVDPASLGGMWDTVVAEGREAEIVNDLKLLEPDLDSIHFLTRAPAGSGILVGLRNGGRRVPIGTYGDGLRRLLALRLSSVGSANGFLLIDEIDTGLHWTVMEEMWQFVVEVARRLNVQIFATTHSYDCIRGLGSLIRSKPEFEDQVTIQKVDRSLPQAVCLRGDQIKVAVEQDIEVR